jgi:hypothetical protein
VDMDRTTTEHLQALSVLVGQTDLADAVLDLARSALSSTPSFMAMHVTIDGTEQPIMVTTGDASTRTVRARSSLRIEIAGGGTPGRHHRVVFLAENPHAFIDFDALRPRATDPTKGLGGHQIEKIVVDGDVPTDATTVPSPRDGNAFDSGDDHRTLERAIGVLLNCGYTVEAAKTEITGRAGLSHRTVVEEARELLRSLRGDLPEGQTRR